MLLKSLSRLLIIGALFSLNRLSHASSDGPPVAPPTEQEHDLCAELEAKIAKDSTPASREQYAKINPLLNELHIDEEPSAINHTFFSLFESEIIDGELQTPVYGWFYKVKGMTIDTHFDRFDIYDAHCGYYKGNVQVVSQRRRPIVEPVIMRTWIPFHEFCERLVEDRFMDWSKKEDIAQDILNRNTYGFLGKKGFTFRTAGKTPFFDKYRRYVDVNTNKRSLHMYEDIHTPGQYRNPGHNPYPPRGQSLAKNNPGRNPPNFVPDDGIRNEADSNPQQPPVPPPARRKGFLADKFTNIPSPPVVRPPAPPAREEDERPAPKLNPRYKADPDPTDNYVPPESAPATPAPKAQVIPPPPAPRKVEPATPAPTPIPVARAKKAPLPKTDPDGVPYGKRVPGHPNVVISPFDPHPDKPTLLNVEGMAGRQMRDPFDTKKIFRVPPEQ